MKYFRNLNMKKLILVLISAAVFPFAKTAAQNPAMEKLNAYKIAFFTKQLNLTPQEAEKFWPVYNEFQSKRSSIQQERAMVNRNINQNELNLTEKEMIEAGDKIVGFQVQEAALSQEYHKKFKEILSPVKVIRLYQAENQYRTQLLNELRDAQQPPRNNQQQRGPGQKKLQ